MDKAGILAARAEFSDIERRAIGVQIVQDETFFVDPKVTEVETRVNMDSEKWVA